MCTILPAVHALTGCDSTASHKGKKSVFLLLSQNLLEFQDLKHLGDSPIIQRSGTVFECAIKFVCLLYQKKCSEFDITKVRSYLFCKKNLSGENLPPYW